MNVIKSSSLLKAGFTVCVLGLSLPVVAATQVLVPVEDRSLSTPSATAKSQVASEAKTKQQQQQNANAELYLLLESLQQEVSQMRGQVEELTFKMRQMQQNQKDRYLDLDRRISNLNEQALAAAKAAQTAQVVVAPKPVIQAHTETPVVDTTVVVTPQAPAAPIDPAQHQADYKAAFNLIRSKKYQESITALETFVVAYPNGPLTGNAYYWLGEVLMVERQTEAAIKNFSKVISEFPKHRKVPDAMYKAGRAWLKLGDHANGQNLLDQVIKLYPDSSAARLARELK